jgi:hypothetical protein
MACTGSSPTWTSTPDSASITTCLNNASRNDTINVSAGSATWSTGTLCPDGVTTAALCISKGVKLVGAGPAQNSATIITNGLGASAVLINLGPDATTIANSDTIRIENFTLDANGGIFRMISVTGAPYNNTKPYKNFLITGNLFRNSSCSNDTGITVGSQARGVIWKNTFDRWMFPFRSFGSGDQRTWQNAAYYPFSYGSADNIYFETNTVHNSTTFSCNGGGWMESGQDGRWVVRFNTIDETNNAAATDFQDSHGTQNYYPGSPNGQTSTMITEWYRNTYITPNSYFRWALIRGSWNFFFDNNITSPGNPYIDVLQYAVPPDTTAGCYNYIQNFDGTAWTGPDMTLQNSYIINNLTNGVLRGAFAHTGDTGNHNNNCGVVENGALSPYGTGVIYGFWNQNNSYNGTTQIGVGRGTLAARPATCTTGDGWWATDQGSWNSGGSGVQGVFYKCTATNTWTLYYTPYLYPHPLTGTSSITYPAPSPMFS